MRFVIGVIEFVNYVMEFVNTVEKILRSIYIFVNVCMCILKESSGPTTWFHECVGGWGFEPHPHTFNE